MLAAKTTSLRRIRPSAKAARTTELPRWARRTLWTLAIVALVVVAIDLTISPIAKAIVNRKLAALPEFTGHVGRLEISIWRGRCEAENFVFAPRHQEGPPLFHVKSAMVNVAYLPALTGHLQARFAIDDMDITVVKSQTTPKKPDGEKKPLQTEAWRAAFQKALPMEITRLEIKNSRFTFIDRTHEKPVQAGLLQFHVLAEGLRTRPKPGVELPAEVVAEGVTSGHGTLTLRIQADPLADTPRFHAQFAVTNVNLPEMNDFLLAYSKIDVARGTFEFESEVTAQGGGYTGYVKPFFKDLDFKTASDEQKSPLQLFAKKAVAAVAQVFKNKAENKVATKAPISGNFEKNDVDVWTTVSNLLRNAFVQAIREGFEGQQPSK